MKAKIWLGLPKKRGLWHYGLGRHEDGSIRVSEILTPTGFAPVGTLNNGKSRKLYASERQRIICDLYLACCHEMSIKPDALGVDVWKEQYKPFC